jgi:glycogen(starch) synthase
MMLSSDIDACKPNSVTLPSRDKPQWLPLNIGIFANEYSGINGFGGVATYLRNLSSGLAAIGHNVHAITVGAEASVHRDGLVTVHIIAGSRFRVIERVLPAAGVCCRLAQAVSHLVSELRLDVVEFSAWEGLGVLYALRRRVPLVVRMHTSSLEAHQIDGTTHKYIVRWDIRRERWLCLLADVLVTHSEAHRRNMASELGIDPARIAIVPHGVTVYPDFVRSRSGTDELTVVSLGRLEKRKGTLDLLRAIPTVLREVPNARFVLVGQDRPHAPGGKMHAQYIAEELPPEVRRRIILTGRLSDEEAARWLQIADLFVAPSHYESFGLNLIEAMRWGTPVVSTRAGAIPEVIEDNLSGLLVAPGHPEELGQAMTAVLKNEPLRKRLGDTGRQRVERLFSTERMAMEVEDLYLHAIQQRHPRKILFGPR